MCLISFISTHILPYCWWFGNPSQRLIWPISRFVTRGIFTSQVGLWNPRGGFRQENEISSPKKLGSSHKTEVQMAWHLHWGFQQLFNLMFLSVQSFQQLCPFIQNLNVASKGIALPKLSNSLFLCWETIWNFVHIADVLGGGGVERDWRGDQYPGSGCGPLGAKKQLRMDEKRGIQHDDLPRFFSSPRCYIQFK